MATNDSVRVEFESTRAVRTDRIPRGAQEVPGNTDSHLQGSRTVVPFNWIVPATGMLRNGDSISVFGHAALNAHAAFKARSDASDPPSPLYRVQAPFARHALERTPSSVSKPDAGTGDEIPYGP